MKSEQVFKHIKLVIWGSLIILLAQAFFTENVFAADNDLDVGERLIALSDTLSQVELAIKRSTTVTDSERAMLLTQLVQVSRAVVVLQRNAALQAAEESLVAINGLEDVKQPRDIGLHRVTAHFDLSGQQVTVTEYYIGPDDDIDNNPFTITYDRVIWTKFLDPVAGTLSFDNLIASYKNQVVTELMNRYGLTDSATVDRIVYTSVRNPRRDQVAAKLNSAEALNLLEDFGNKSIVTNVRVYSDSGHGQIEIESDQNERMVLSLMQTDTGRSVTTGSDSTTTTGEYGYSFELYEGPVTSVSGNRHRENLIVRQQSNGLTKAALLAVINNLFAEIPFTSYLENADETLLDFLLDNSVYYRSRTAYVPEQVPECVSDGDRVVVDEYVLQLLSGISAHYILDNLAIEYPSRLLKGGTSGGGQCFQQSLYF